jgi:glycosyltransferase involved in cell wall biosynthesis
MEKIKVLFDYKIFSIQKYGGISRYFFELIEYFGKDREVSANVSLLVSNNYYMSKSIYIKHFKFFPDIEFKGKYKIMSLIDKINFFYHIYLIKRKDFDIYHLTYYNDDFLKHIGGKPFVVTVYDMIHEKLPDFFPKHDKTTIYKKNLVNKSTKVIAISESTKNDLIEIFGTDPDKIEVIYLGNSTLSGRCKITNIPKNYILFVGSRKGYKNYNLFITAVSRELRDDCNLYVICAGGGAFDRDEVSLMNTLGIQKKVLQYDLDDGDLQYLYKNAKLFVFPSLYEGFGIPMLEAFSCECPLVCSNTSSFPEVAGDGAIYFDPYSENSICGVVSKVLHNNKLQKQLIKEGRARLKYFSWKETANNTKEVYKSILGKSSDMLINSQKNDKSY